MSGHQAALLAVTGLTVAAAAVLGRGWARYRNPGRHQVPVEAALPLVQGVMLGALSAGAWLWYLAGGGGR